MSTKNDEGMIAAVMTATKPKFTDIDPAAIEVFLSGQPDVSGPVTITNVRGGGADAGASSGVVVFDATIGGETAGYVLRYAPMRNEGRIFFDYGIADQFELQRRLASGGMAVPMARWVDPDGSFFGLPGFIMDIVPGSVAHASPFSAGLIGDAEPALRQRRINSIFAALGKVHDADWQALGVENFTRRGEGRTPFERYINWYWKTVEWVQPAERARLERLRTWLFANQPDHHVDDLSLVHGDPSLGNYMLAGDAVTAVIDWELAGIVSPSYDIAMQVAANGYYRAVSGPETAARIPSDDEWIADYERASGRKLKDFEFYSKAVTLPLLIVQISMARNFPPEVRDQYVAGMESIWAVTETA